MSSSISSGFSSMSGIFSKGLSSLGGALSSLGSSLMSGLSSAGGALSGGLGGLSGMLMGMFQMGGNYTGNEPFIAGERGPELIQPNGPGRVLNNKDTESAGGQSKSTDIINIVDPDLASGYINSPSGESDIMNIISNNRERIKGLIK